PGEFIVCSRPQVERLMVGLFIVILEIFRTQIDSIRIVISKKTDFRIPTKKAIIPSAGVVGVSTGVLSILMVVCSGQALAEQGTQITIARLLWGFHFLKAKDANGNDIDIDIFDYTNRLNWRPRPFKCVIKPRHQEIDKTIRMEGEQAL